VSALPYIDPEVDHPASSRRPRVRTVVYPGSPSLPCGSGPCRGAAGGYPGRGPELPGGQAEQAQAEVGWGGDGANQERSAGVAEFAADLGGAHGLAEPARWGGGGEGGEAEGGDDAGTDADGDRGDAEGGRFRQQSGDGEPGGGQGQPGGGTEEAEEAAGVVGAAGAGG
jgi:hypothetical protein